MKYLFATLAILLAAAGMGTYLSFPGTVSDVPVIYWGIPSSLDEAAEIDGASKWRVDLDVILPLTPGRTW